MSARPVATALATTRAQFDLWRQGCRGRGRIPDRLWHMALALIPRFCPQTVARELGLNPHRLQARLERTQPSPTPRASKKAFVELRAVDLVPPSTPAPAPTRPARQTLDTTVTVQVERPDGARLTFSVPAAHRGPIEEVCTAFLRA